MSEQKEKKKPGTKINSRHKGSEYERKIAKILGKWWGEDFHRTPASGGLHWKKDNRVAGDIVTPPDSVYPWVTECKKREAWDFDQLIKGTGEIEKYWSQVCRDAEETGLQPLLIFSKNFAPNYAMILEDQFNIIMEHLINEMGKSFSFNYFVVHKDGYPNRVVFILEDWLGCVSKDDVVNALGL
ncbi:hypothetical protein D1872_52070 [compost metagenome]